MGNGIKQEKNGWVIDTTIKIGNTWKHCKLTGYKSKRDALTNYYNDIEKWKISRGYIVDCKFFNTIIEEYKVYRSVRVKASCLVGDNSQYTTHINKLGTMVVGDVLNHNFIKTWFFSLMNDKTISNSKKDRVIRVMRGLCKFAYDNGYVVLEEWRKIDNALVPMKGSEIIHEEKRVIPQNHLEAFLGTIDKGGIYFPIFSLFVYCGCRLREFLGICVDCYDYGKRKIIIKRQVEKNGNLINTLKTKQSYRELLLTQEMNELLQDYIKKTKPKEKLFDFSATTFLRKMHDYEKSAGIPQYKAHEFRHTKATLLAKRCKTMSDVIICARFMGHSPSMFLDTYCNHLNEADESKLLG